MPPVTAPTREASRRRLGTEVIQKLQALHDKYPSLRVCQIIGNAVPYEEAQRRNNDLYYVEDQLLLQWLEEYEQKADQNALRAASERPSKP